MNTNGTGQPAFQDDPLRLVVAHTGKGVGPGLATLPADGLVG